MFSTKFGSYQRIIQLPSKQCNQLQLKFNLQNRNYLHLVCISNSTNKYRSIPIYASKNTVNNNLSWTSLLKSSNYSTKTIEVPSHPPTPPEPDEFGALGSLKYEKVELDEEELKEEERLKNIKNLVPRKFKPTLGQYAKMIKKYIEKGDLNGAEEVLELCKKNLDKPSDYMYNLLIYAFARQGDLKKCYMYFSTMKSKKMKIKDNTYTSMFNACGNFSDSDKALDYLRRIREYMIKYKVPLKHAHYNVLVKAYGRHHQFKLAQQYVQEMKERKLKIGISTLNSLMYAANSDTESGLTEVLRIWQLMRRDKIPPNIFTYNLLLRAIRDTHFGNCTVNDLFLPDSSPIVDKKRPNLLLYPPTISPLPFDNIQRKDSENVSALLSPSTAEQNTENITSLPATTSESAIALDPSIANMNLDEVLKQNKLILFGGLDGLVEKMKDDRITPNIKTITFLMELVPNSIAAETAVIKYAKTEKIQLDLDFYNMLMKKRVQRGQKAEALAVLDEVHRDNLKPNIVTYGVLALSCTTSNEGRDLISSMKSTGHTLNKYVADTLLQGAFKRRSFGFILELMASMRAEKIRLDEETFEKLDEFQQKMSELIRAKHPCTKSDKFKAGFSAFNIRYKSWQEDMGRKAMTERVSKRK